MDSTISGNPAIDLHEIAVAEVTSQALLAANKEFIAQLDKVFGADDAFLDANRIAPDRDLTIAFSASL